MGNKPQQWYAQSSVIPYRVTNGETEILLITTRKGKWIVPKGIIEASLDSRSSALNEALEEAGIAGDLDIDEVGSYSYEKWEGMCSVLVYSMHVTAEFETWQEQKFRLREWVPASLAVDRVASKPLRELLRSFIANSAGRH